MEMVKFKYTCKYCKDNVVISCTLEDAEVLKKMYEAHSVNVPDYNKCKLIHDVKRIVSIGYCRVHARSIFRNSSWDNKMLDKLHINDTITFEDGPVIKGCVIEKS